MLCSVKPGALQTFAASGWKRRHMTKENGSQRRSKRKSLLVWWGSTVFFHFSKSSTHSRALVFARDDLCDFMSRDHLCLARNSVMRYHQWATCSHSATLKEWSLWSNFKRSSVPNSRHFSLPCLSSKATFGGIHANLPLRGWNCLLRSMSRVWWPQWRLQSRMPSGKLIGQWKIIQSIHKVWHTYI